MAAYNPRWLQEFWRRATVLAPVFNECDGTRDLQKVLRHHFPRFKQVGRGMFAVVLAPPCNQSKVLRFSVDHEDYRGWWRYGTICKYTNHQHLPRIHRLLHHPGSSIHCAVLDRCDGNAPQRVLHQIEDILYDAPVRHNHSLKECIDLLKFCGVHPNDIGPGNVMMRNKVPILIDPLA